ncbi:CPBP family intramembrane glutamic endopeptidase [Leucobacter sp. PH1c]|uniref:CPBP family intramembrane glutamic endopeptidase n=1 Tax=Leucobacter sp. PH1c TaxID=1397278 RepID=UPI00046A191A|nr:type II CAAX endopeptidase family protein [Leucobacter sp. PH1c]
MTSNGPELPAQPEPAPQDPAPQGSPPPQQWAWAQQAPVQVQTVETEPLEYHRLLRGMQGYRWWKPLLLLLLSGVYFGVFTVAVTLLFMPVVMFLDPSYLTDVATGASEMIDTQRPVSVALSMVSIIIMIPAVLLAMLSLGIRPVGRVWSVATRIRWGLLARLFAAAVLSVVVMNGVGIGIQFLTDPSAGAMVAGPAADFDASAALWSLLLIVLLVPFQATAEEVVFRGLFMQVLGSWLKNPWFAILIPTVGFAAAHIYDIWGLAAVGLMGGVAAWLTWRTGGLEAAIAIHVVNNLIAFGLMTAAVGGETAQTADGGSISGVIGEIAGLALFIWLTLRICARGRHGRTRIDLVQQAVPAWQPAAPTVPGVQHG